MVALHSVAVRGAGTAGKLRSLHARIRESFSGKPFPGRFTFGEQGARVGRNVHGSPMFSAIAFGA